jgi:hypothetical protein
VNTLQSYYFLLRVGEYGNNMYGPDLQASIILIEYSYIGSVTNLSTFLVSFDLR